MKRFLSWTCLCAAVGLLAGACGDDKTGNGPSDDDFDDVTLEFFTAAPLPAGLIYQLWALPDDADSVNSPDEWTSLARFNLRASDTAMVRADGTLIPGNKLDELPVDLADYDSLVVTVEAANGDGPLPSEAIYLRGTVPNLVGGFHIAALSFIAPTIVTTIDSISQYTFVSPTDSDTGNGLSGVWFMTPNFTLGLANLDPLPPGWVYEGWVEVERGSQTWQFSTGRFTAAAGEDESCTHCGPIAPPLYPGEDFLVPPGGTPTFPLTFVPGDVIRITMEPEDDPQPNSPFPLVVFASRAGMIPDVLQPFRLAPHPESIPAAQGTITKDE